MKNIKIKLILFVTSLCLYDPFIAVDDSRVVFLDPVECEFSHNPETGKFTQFDTNFYSKGVKIPSHNHCVIMMELVSSSKKTSLIRFQILNEFELVHQNAQRLIIFTRKRINQNSPIIAKRFHRIGFGNTKTNRIIYCISYLLNNNTGKVGIVPIIDPSNPKDVVSKKPQELTPELTPEQEAVLQEAQDRANEAAERAAAKLIAAEEAEKAAQTHKKSKRDKKAKAASAAGSSSAAVPSTGARSSAEPAPVAAAVAKTVIEPETSAENVGTEEVITAIGPELEKPATEEQAPAPEAKTKRRWGKSR